MYICLCICVCDYVCIHTFATNKERVREALDRIEIECDNFHFNKSMNKHYDTEFKNLQLTTPWQAPNVYSSYHLYPILIRANSNFKNQKLVYDEFKKNDIGVNLHYISVHRHPYYEHLGFKKNDFPVAEKLHKFENMWSDVRKSVQSNLLSDLFRMVKVVVKVSRISEILRVMVLAKLRGFFALGSIPRSSGTHRNMNLPVGRPYTGPMISTRSHFLLRRRSARRAPIHGRTGDPGVTLGGHG